VADIAFVVPGMTPDRFRDNAVMELPGLFRNLREATLTYTRLVATNVIKGYEDFFVIGTFASDLENIHTRPAVSSLGDLKGKKIRVNNQTEAAALTKLGMVPAVIPINTVSESISRGDIDGAAVPPSMLFEFGIAPRRHLSLLPPHQFCPPCAADEPQIFRSTTGAGPGDRSQA
jgi:TRAP-type C4-dicarboxylate transport system substrate-binding protein